MLDGKRILVTGGTGSFGNHFVDFLTKKYDCEEIIIYSRDELKQYQFRIDHQGGNLSFVIGDVRDREAMRDAMKGVDFVFHAAALKQVPSCEFHPMEAVKTNVTGTANVLDAAEAEGVSKVVVLSTDKAVYPINAMGISKAMMEKITLAKAAQTKSDTVFCGVRYGNVMYSRGSIIPRFIAQIKNKEPLTITHPDMTRFLLPLPVAVELVAFAMEEGRGGDLFVRKAPAATVEVVAKALLKMFGGDNELLNIGIRAGEKMHETLVTKEELHRAREFDDYYQVTSEAGEDYDKYYREGVSREIPEDGYTSENTERLDIDGAVELLKTLPQVQAELSQ